MRDCIFCKISKGELPSYKIFEDEDFFVFLDISPFVRGHLLIIPKEHYEWVWDLSFGKYKKFTELVYKITKALQKTFKTDWIEEIIEGVGVKHAHIHLLPRTEEDGLGTLPTEPLKQKPTEEEMKNIAESIRKNILD